MANAYMSTGVDSKHEYYVTVYADEHQEGAASDIVNVNNLARKLATPQVRQQKINEHLAESKVPRMNAAIPAASKATISSKTIDVDVKFFKPDKPGGVSVAKVGRADVDFPCFCSGLKKVKLPLQLVSYSQIVPDSSIAKQNVFAYGYTRPECIQKYPVWCPGDCGTAVGKSILV